MRIHIKELDVKEIKEEQKHSNYLEYLSIAWANHYEVVLSPDIVWYSILCEMANIVKEKPEAYRGLFSDSEEKQEIVVISGSLTEMPMPALIAELQKFVPTQTEVFFPVFSESTEDYRLAAMTSFADMVSPYYNYSMLMCGIPAIHLEGTKEDWLKLKAHVWGVMDVLGWHEDYFLRVEGLVTTIIGQYDYVSLDFWKEMFVMEQCGSGHEQVINGWITDLFVNTPDLRKVQNFSTHVASITYKQLNTGKNYQMKRGLFNSSVDGDRLVPRFGCEIEEIKD